MFLPPPRVPHNLLGHGNCSLTRIEKEDANRMRYVMFRRLIRSKHGTKAQELELYLYNLVFSATLSARLGFVASRTRMFDLLFVAGLWSLAATYQPKCLHYL